jgi:hypothetical protein
MRSRNAIGLFGLFAATVVVIGTGSAAQAATTTGSATDKCANTISAQDLNMSNSPSTTKVDSVADAAEAQLKAQTDTYTGLRPERSASHDARKLADAKRGNPNACSAPGGVSTNATSGPGYAYISWLYHYGQNTGSWCGEATVAEISSTTPGPSRLGIPQSEIAGWLGNGPNDGTSVDQMVSALNHYVGVPDFGWNFYSMVWMNGNPTAAQRATFLSNVQTDIGTFNSPVSGNAWEVVGGHHLNGHPNQQIFHHFAIGGWNTNSSQIWYTDSATTVWAAVPAYSWYDMYNLETILGGRGYVW